MRGSPAKTIMTCTFQPDSPNPKIYGTVPHSSLAPSVNCKHNDMTPYELCRPGNASDPELRCRHTISLKSEMVEKAGLLRHLQSLCSLRQTRGGFSSQPSCRPFGDFVLKWRRRRDSNPRNPFEVHFFSKEALSATQPLLPAIKES